MVLAKWTLYAKCANDPEIQDQLNKVRSGFGKDPFYPSKGNGQESKAGEWGKDYCSNCPVRLSCLAEAMQSIDLDNPWKLDTEQGVWGGLTKRSRVALKKKQRAQIQQISARMKEQFPDNEDPIAS
jgi:hypothetical protein